MAKPYEVFWLAQEKQMPLLLLLDIFSYLIALQSFNSMPISQVLLS